MPPLDRKKIEDFLSKWNAGKPTPEWTEVPSAYAAMEMVINSDSTVTFIGDRGYPMKCFRNVHTGEIKMFDARIFAP